MKSFNEFTTYLVEYLNPSDKEKVKWNMLSTAKREGEKEKTDADIMNQLTYARKYASKRNSPLKPKERMKLINQWDSLRYKPGALRQK